MIAIKNILNIIKRDPWLLGLVFLVFMYFFSERMYERANGGKPVVVELYEKQMMRFKFRYEVNGIVYDKTSTKEDPDVYRAYKIGEKYVGLYDTLDADNLVVLYDRPVFDSSSFGNAVGSVIASRYMAAEFEYMVNGKKYHRFQVIDPDKEFNVEPYLGKVYLVKYNKINPAIGYIFLDSVQSVVKYSD